MPTQKEINATAAQIACELRPQGKTNYQEWEQYGIDVAIAVYKKLTAPAEPEPRTIDFTRVNNDVYGNPRYVCHFLTFITNKDRETPEYEITSAYDIALRRARKLNGRKFHNKQYGGGIAFQSYNIKTLEKDIFALVAQYE